jgi:hypothetical protein
MQRAIYLIAAIGVVATAMAIAQNKEPLEGTEPYTPTKLEWLCVELNAEFRKADDILTCSFVADPTSNTIVVHCIHFPHTNREFADFYLEESRKRILNKAKEHGWNWVRIRKHVQEIDTDKPT